MFFPSLPLAIRWLSGSYQGLSGAEVLATLHVEIFGNGVGDSPRNDECDADALGGEQDTKQPQQQPTEQDEQKQQRGRGGRASVRGSVFEKSRRNSRRLDRVRALLPLACAPAQGGPARPGRVTRRACWPPRPVTH
jgi:hypothetical protein